MTATQVEYDAIKTSPAAHAAGDVDVPNRTLRLMILLFMLGMVVPIWIKVGPLLLMPHRIVLLLLFIPLLMRLLSGKAGRIMSFDILMFFSTFWACLAILVSASISGVPSVQPLGIYVLESFGAYLLGRVAIRSRDDFLAFTKIFFVVLLILVPFAALEALTHRAVMLELIPQSVRIVYQEDRWGMRRAQTVFGHPILFGVFAAMGFGIFWYAMRSKLTRFGGALMAMAGAVFSLSTGALISIVIQAVLIGWEKVTKKVPRRWTIFACLCALFYVAIDLLSNRTPFHVLITYATFNTGNSYNRILIWRFGMENVWENPFFGLGENVWAWKRPDWMSSSADNYWLLLAMKYGIPSFLGMAGALFLIIRKAAQAPLVDPLSIACRAGYLTAIGGVIIAGGTVHFWHGVMAFVMFFFGAGVWVIDAAKREQEALEAGTKDTSDTIVPEASGADGMIYTRQPVRHSRTRSVPTKARIRPGRGR